MQCPKCKKEMRYDINCFNGGCDYKHGIFKWLIYTKEGRIILAIYFILIILILQTWIQIKY